MLPSMNVTSPVGVRKPDVVSCALKVTVAFTSAGFTFDVTCTTVEASGLSQRVRYHSRAAQSNSSDEDWFMSPKNDLSDLLTFSLRQATRTEYWTV